MTRLLTSGLIGFPKASIPCNKAVQWGPAVWYVSVCRLGGGPGLNVELARLSSHVPTRDSLCAEATDARTATRHSGSPTRMAHPTSGNLTFFIMLPLSTRKPDFRCSPHSLYSTERRHHP